jgi:tungstate transport system substrate-binding protein
VKKEWAQQFADWLISSEGQTAIGAFKINAQQLFHPNASDPAA